MDQNCTTGRDSWGASCPTIGYLAVSISYVGTAIWSGMADAARRQGVNLICFIGEKLRDPNGFLAQANVIYDLVDSSRIDGLVVWTSSIGAYIDHQECVAFIEGYQPLPIVSLGTVLDGIPSVQVENYPSMREMMTHLIEVHGYRRLALIRGPENHPYAQERYHAYVDALAEHDLPLDPNLIALSPDWDAGSEMTCLLLDQRGLQPGVDIEVIVTVSDVFALDVLETLQARGIPVPGEIGVTGFNDTLGGRAVTPPLTSVTTPFAKQGEQALEMVLAMLAGEQVPEQVALPSQLVVRQSCGCAYSAVVQAEVARVDDRGDPSAPGATLEIIPEARQEKLISEMAQAVQIGAESLVPDWARRLVQAFTTEVETATAGTFLTALERVLAQARATGDDVLAWQNGMSLLRRYALSHYCDDDEALYRAENLVQQARVFVSEITQRSQLHREVQTKEYTQTLRGIGQTLIATFDMAKLRDTLIQGFPALGIPSCYLSLYEDPQAPTGMARLVLAYDHTGQIELEPGNERFPSSQLVPNKLLAHKKRYSMVVTSLYFEENQLGFALFEMGPSDEATYETLRGQISSALQGALLLRERQRAEAALRQRTLELEAHNAELDAFAHTVAHDLKNPVAGLIGLSTMLESSIDEFPSATVDDLLHRITQAGYKIINIINALLLLSSLRREEVQGEALDMADIVSEAQKRLADLAAERQTEISVPDEWPAVVGYAPWVEEVWVNYISNALKYGGDVGEEVSPRIELGFDEMTDLHVRFWVRDNGPGLTPEAQVGLFTPFTRLHQVRVEGHGLGLSIVQRIVEKLGGEVGVESQMGEGSLFYFTLPVATAVQRGAGAEE